VFFFRLLIACIIPVTLAHADEFSISQIRDYYASVPGNYIEASEAPKTKPLPNEQFYLTMDNSFVPSGEHELDLEFSQDLFQVDVKKFNKFMQGDDFLDSKVKFYSALFFNGRSQSYEKPYTSMNGWFSLNHPPIKKLNLPLEHYSKLFAGQIDQMKGSQFFNPQFQSKLDQETKTELTFNNHLHALFNDQSIKAKIQLVKDAKHYLFGAVMATVCDPSSEEFVQALIDKAQSGVPVTLMMEHFYMGIVFRKCANRLRAGGVDVVLVNDKWKAKTFLSFFHIKFWIRDGEEAIIGGQNIVKYDNSATGFNQLNRDTDLQIRGPAVSDLLAEYLTMWKKHRKSRNRSLTYFEQEVERAKTTQRELHLRGNQFYQERLSNPESRMRGTCRILVQKAHDHTLSIASVLGRYAALTQESMVLTSPEIEFSLYGRIKAKLKRDHLFNEIRNAAKRGVDVELVSNGVDGGNGEFTVAMRLAMQQALEWGRKIRYHFWKAILKREPAHNARGHRKHLLDLEDTPGVRAWTHFNYMHAKQAFFDRIVTSISSVNLDAASLERNEEAGAICMDETLSKEMENQLTLDLVNSIPVASTNERH